MAIENVTCRQLARITDLEGGNGSVLGNRDVVVFFCANALQLSPLVAIPSQKHNGPHCLVAHVPRQEGRGFVPVCGGQLGSGACGTQ